MHMFERILKPHRRYFLEHVLSTFPVEARDFQITLEADGLGLPEGGEQEEHKYLDYCVQMGINPFSALNMGVGKNRLVSSTIECLSHDGLGITEDEVMKGVLARRKFYRLVFKQREEGNFRKFVEEYLQNLFLDGYRAVNAYLSTPFEGSEVSDFTYKKNVDRHIFRLRVNPKENSRNRNLIMGWYEELERFAKQRTT